MPNELVGALQPLAGLKMNNNEIRTGLAGGLINKRIMKVMTRRISLGTCETIKQLKAPLNPCIKFVITLVRINHFSLGLRKIKSSRTKLIFRAYVGCVDKVSFSVPRKIEFAFESNTSDSEIYWQMKLDYC